jgi:hypothetical protein
LRPWVRIALFACAAGCLAACTEAVDLTTESRYGEYNRQTDWAKNEAILLNIVRASEYQPLNFMSFQPYTGQATVSAAASSPAFIIGPDRVNSQKQYTLGQGSLTASATANGTISLTMLDTQDFYEAVLDPVDFTDLNTFQRQGYPRELLFRLFANSVTLRPTNPQMLQYSVIVYNDPVSQNQCVPLGVLANRLYGPNPNDFQKSICFNHLVEFALLSGLSSETRTVNNPAASQTKASAAGGGGTGQNPSAPQTTLQGRLCFDPALANRYKWQYYQHEMNNIQSGTGSVWPTKHSLDHFINAIGLVQYHPVCGQMTGDDQWPATASTTGGPAKPAPAKPAPPATPAPPAHAEAPAAPTAPAASDAAAPAAPAHPTTPVAASAGGHTIATAATDDKPGVAILKVVVPEITGSPVWDIHKLLTDQVEIGTRSTFAMYNFLGRLLNTPEPDDSNRLIGSEADDDDRQILTVNKGQVVGCFVSVFTDVGEYCVPIDGAQNTKRAFSILSQLLALKTTTGDLQLTPTLRLVP